MSISLNSQIVLIVFLFHSSLMGVEGSISDGLYFVNTVKARFNDEQLARFNDIRSFKVVVGMDEMKIGGKVTCRIEKIGGDRRAIIVMKLDKPASRSIMSLVLHEDGLVVNIGKVGLKEQYDTVLGVTVVDDL